MPASELQDTLRIGLAVVSEMWHYTAKNWVTTVAAADIDSDGDTEILAGSRDGRVHALTERGDLRWERIVGNKSWVGTLTTLPENSPMVARMLVGNREGMVFALDKDGKTVSPDGKLYSFNGEGRVIEAKKELSACWLKSEQVIRQVVFMPATATSPCMIVAGSEDRRVYALDAESGQLLWTFPTQGPVRAIFATDVNGDGATEILVGSGDHYLYLLDSQGQNLQQHHMGDRQIHTIFASDVDKDGEVEILLGTDAKDLLVLKPDLSCKWSHLFPNRILCLQVADLDNDGHNEILAGSEDKHLYILDHQGNQLWRHNLGSGVFSLYAIDFDHDGQIELIAGSEDNRLHVLRIRLARQLARKIRRQYQSMGKPPLDSLSDLLPAEQALLQDILEEEYKQHTTTKAATIESARQLVASGEHLAALAELLRLQEQKVQQRWSKDKVGHIRALYLGDISGDPRREVIIGTANGTIQAFNTAGRPLWSLPLSGQILALQTGYLDHRRWQDILACSSDHHIYVISGTKKSVRRKSYIGEWMSSFYLLAPERHSVATVIAGTEDKQLRFYGNDLSTPLQTISTPQGIKIVCAYDATRASHPPGEQVPEVIAGSLENTVYAYSRHGRFLWSYHTQDRVLAIAIKDLDGDGRVEIIIGSEDRNVHVLSNDGHLKWRYFTEHRVIAIDACDLDGDGRIEVLAGCGDGKLYVLSNEGDLLWHYQTNDRIRVVRAEDIDDDGHVEIALGSEDRLELLRVVNQAEVNQLITQCWQALVQERRTDNALNTLLTHTNPLLRAFALRSFAERAAEQIDSTAHDFTQLEECLKDGALSVRQALISAVICCYPINPGHAHLLLNQLSTSGERLLRVSFVEQLPALMQHNWDLGMEYLGRFLRNRDRFVRRAVIRQISQLIPTAPEEASGALLQLLFQGFNDDDSIWICQESARVFAHFLDHDSHKQQIVTYLYAFITNCGNTSMLRYVSYYARNPQVQHLYSAMASLLKDLNETNAPLLVDQAVSALAEVRTLPYGQDSWQLYQEFAHLLSLQTLEAIADYRCSLQLNRFTLTNEYVPLVLHIMDRLGTITRLLSIYLRRKAINDQLNSLLEAITAIEDIQAYLERQYSGMGTGEAMSRMPDRKLFEIILRQWHTIIKAQFGELSGRPDLKITLQTSCARREDEVGVLLLISNMGRSSANNVKTTLLDNHDFTVVGPRSHEIHTIFPQEEILAEFTIRPRSSLLNLSFETVYYDEFVYGDTDRAMRWLTHEERMELTPPPQEFKHIPNPYSTGTPTRDKNMFYGRAQDIAFLKDNLTRTEAKSVIVLYGQRRSGKTTLLYHLVNSSVLDEHIPVLIDMQQEEYNITVNKFLHHMAHYIFQALHKRGISVARPEKSQFASDPTFAFDLFLDEVESHLSGQKIILLLDEFEVLETQVKKGKLEAEIFAYLRSLMQNRQNLNFVLSGTHEIGQLTKGYWSVFFNIAHHYRLARLAPQDAKDLITLPVADYLEYEPYAVHKIRILTGDQPYLIHLVCRSLVDQCNSRHKSYVTIHDVNIVQQNVMQTGQFHFDWIWDQITQEEQIALSTIAEGRKEEGRLISLPEIEDLYRQHHLTLKRDSLLAAIKKLADLDVIDEVTDDTQSSPERKRYRISVGLIGKWLRKEKSLELLNGTTIL